MGNLPAIVLQVFSLSVHILAIILKLRLEFMVLGEQLLAGLGTFGERDVLIPDRPEDASPPVPNCSARSFLDTIGTRRKTYSGLPLSQPLGRRIGPERQAPAVG